MTPICAVTGIGRSAIGRRLGVPALNLAVDAALAAISDAGLDFDAIDGIACWPGRNEAAGVSPVGTWELRDALRLNTNWYAGGFEGAAQLASLINSVGAIAAGQASNILCFRVSTESSERQEAPRPDLFVDDWQQWLLPFGASSLANWVALAASRHFAAYGTTRTQLGAIAINARRNALLNPDAPYQEPLTMEAYLGARMISTPLCLYDCDVPVDGAVAMVISAADVAKAGPRRPVWIEAIAGALHGRSFWDQQSLDQWGPHDAARRMWSMTKLTPADIDYAELYDGFSFLTLSWLEALGFCEAGAGGSFVEAGERISREGKLPINLGGGQLSGGRLHGLGLVLEAVTQLRGEAGLRQLKRQPRTAVVSNGGGPWASCMILARQ